VEFREKRGEKMLARYRAGSQDELSRDWEFSTCELLASFSVQGKNPLRVVVKAMTRLGQEGAASLAAKQPYTQRLFQSLDTLAHGGLRQAERPGSGRKAIQLCGPGECLKVRKL
jgi:hypothetical protein